MSPQSTMERIVKQMNRCSHSELELVRQHAFFSWFKCRKCQLRKMVETHPQPKPLKEEDENGYSQE